MCQRHQPTRDVVYVLRSTTRLRYPLNLAGGKTGAAENLGVRHSKLYSNIGFCGHACCIGSIAQLMRVNFGGYPRKNPGERVGTT